MPLTRRERMLTAMRLEPSDCVPVCPDISNMVPCRVTGRPLWKHFFPDVDGVDAAAYHGQRRDWGERGVYGTWVPSPSINLFFDWIVEGLDECVTSYYEDKGLLDGFHATCTRHYLGRSTGFSTSSQT